MAERDIKISEKTIRRRLSIEFGLKSYRPAQKSRFTEAMNKKRLKFAKNILTGTQRCKKMFFFSDGSTIKQFSSQKYRVGKLPGARYKEKFITPIIEHPSLQMILGGHVSKG